MKHTMMIMMLTCGAVYMAHAQGTPHGWGPPRGAPPQMEKASVSGALTIAQGRIAIIQNDVTYLLAGLNRFVGFIDGLKEGASVSVEGEAFSREANAAVKLMRVQKLTLNGKDYSLAPSRTEGGGLRAAKQKPPRRMR